MKTRLKQILVLVALAAGLLVTPTVSALNPLDKACQGAGAQSAACTGTGSDPVAGPNGVLAKVTKIIAILAGIAAVIMILVSAIMYVTSDGDASKISTAKSALIGSLVGVVIVVSAQAILTFVLTKVN